MSGLAVQIRQRRESYGSFMTFLTIRAARRRNWQVLRGVSIETLVLLFPRSLSPQVVGGERESSAFSGFWMPASAGMTAP